MVFFSRSSEWLERERRAPLADEPSPDHELESPIRDDPFARARLMGELRGRPRRRAPAGALAGLLSFVRGASS
jgi:hypothetical protein